MKLLYSSFALRSIFFQIRNAPRLDTVTWVKLQAAGIAKTIHRGCRSGKNRPRQIAVVQGYGINSFQGYSTNLCPKNYIYSRFQTGFFSGYMQISPTFDKHKHNASLDPIVTDSTGFNGLQPTCTFPNELNVVSHKNLIYVKTDSKIGSGLLNPIRKSCSFSLLNCRSLCNKTDAIKDYVVDHDIDILATTETWLRPDPLDTVVIGNFTPTGYRFHHIARDTRGGGVGLLHKNALNFNQDSSVFLKRFKSFEVIDLKLDWHSTCVHILVVYRPPSVITNVFLNEFGILLEYYTTTPGALIIAGDFNLHVDSKSDPVANNFLHLLDSFNLRQNVHHSTHHAGHTLDLIITREDEDIIGPVSINDSSISDHYNVNCNLRLVKPGFERRCVLSRNIKSIDINQFRSDVAGSLGSDLSDDINELTYKYHSELTRILDVHAPQKKRHVTIRPAAPWYNDDIKAAKRRRRRLERRWRRSRDPVDRNNYTEQCCMVNELLRSSRTDYYSQLISTHGNDQKKLFAAVSKLLHNSPDKGRYPCHTSEDDLAEKFMNFFDSKIRVIRLELDVQCDSNTDVLPDIQVKNCNLVSFEPVSVNTLLDKVKSSVGKSCELDPIPGCLLRDCQTELGPVLTNIVNLSLHSAVMPDVLKVALLRPLLKKPSLDHREFKNFRPISNLQFLSKTIEKVVSHQLTDYLNKNELLEPYQSAYKRYHSSETALIRVHNDILMAIDKHQSVILILLDISAAFDTIDHGILLSRLKHRFGICGKALSWFSSYLSGRCQYVKVGNNESSSYSLKQGVPQGSVLGPILYSLYTSPLGDIAKRHGLSFHFYADDTQLYIAFNSLDSDDMAISKSRLESCVCEINQWMVNNKLKLSGDKSKLLVLSSSYRPRPPLDSVSVGNDVVLSVSSARNIGVIFDDSMSLVPQVTNICKTACYHLRGLFKIRKFLSHDSTTTLVHAFVTSRLDYCNALLFGLPDYVIKRLQLIQNTAARLVFLARKYDHVTPLLVELHWLPIVYRIKFKILLVTFKVLHGIAPSYLCDLLKPYAPGRALRSESKKLLCKPRFNLINYGQRSFQVAAPTLWNDLPINIKNSLTLSSFKKQLKTFLFKKAFT